jgi:lipoic acid synthetase
MNANAPFSRKPRWLRASLGNNPHYTATAAQLNAGELHTICQSGRCPNRGECWNQRTATFLIAGKICTRSCKFCNTATGRPFPLDPDEPMRVAQSIRQLGIRHAVITSVDRDDLEDGGADHWVAAIHAVRAINPGITMETLIPDFGGKTPLLDRIFATRPEILSHNLETVRRLTPTVRSVARYETSLDVLRQTAEADIPAKSSLMLGLGEKEDEVLETLHDLRAVGCSLLTIGQYLRPAVRNLPVVAYIPPETFEYYRRVALSLNFTHVESGPLVRSSYHSASFLHR